MLIAWKACSQDVNSPQADLQAECDPSENPSKTLIETSKVTQNPHGNVKDVDQPKPLIKERFGEQTQANSGSHNQDTCAVVSGLLFPSQYVYNEMMPVSAIFQ